MHCKSRKPWSVLLQFVTLYILTCKAQMGGDEKMIAALSVTCPEDGGFTGDPVYINAGPTKAPLFGSVACIDNPPTQTLAGREQKVSRIYGPFEAGFTNDQLKRFYGCASDTFTLPGGIDTKTAKDVMEHGCQLQPGSASILKDCGMHADPAHAHEDMSCLYSPDPVSQHSTRVGVALDGNGIYGKYIDGGVLPTDLDGCGGRYGVTPDSNGQVVYYYVITERPPFTLGCFGPATLQECRDMYNTCGDDETDLETADGTVKYDIKCPCYDADGSNIGNAVIPSASPTPVSPTPSPTVGSVPCSKDLDCDPAEFCDEVGVCAIPASPSPSCDGPCCCEPSQYCDGSACINIDDSDFDYLQASSVSFSEPYLSFDILMISDIQFWYIKCKDEPQDQCIYSLHSGGKDTVMLNAVTRHSNCINNLAHWVDYKVIIDGGDLTNTGAKYELADYDKFIQELAPGVPKALVLGNHDYYQLEIPDEKQSARMITYLKTSLDILRDEGQIGFRSADFGETIINVPNVGNTKFVKGSLMYSFEINGIVFIAMHWAPALKGGRYVDSFSITTDCPGDEDTCGTISGLPEYYEITDGFLWLESELVNAEQAGKKVVLVPHFVSALQKYLAKDGASSIRPYVQTTVIAILTGHDHDQWGFWGSLLVDNTDASIVKGDVSGIPVYYGGSVTYEKFLTIRFNYENSVPSMFVEQYTTDSVTICATTGPDTDDNIVTSPTPTPTPFLTAVASASPTSSPSTSTSVSATPPVSASASITPIPSIPVTGKTCLHGYTPFQMSQCSKSWISVTKKYSTSNVDEVVTKFFAKLIYGKFIARIELPKKNMFSWTNSKGQVKLKAEKYFLQGVQMYASYDSNSDVSLARTGPIFTRKYRWKGDAQVLESTVSLPDSLQSCCGNTAYVHIFSQVDVAALRTTVSNALQVEGTVEIPVSCKVCNDGFAAGSPEVSKCVKCA